MSFYRRYGKRVFDVVVVVAALVVLSPLLIILALVSMAKIGRPILFRQVRAGKSGVPFRIFKFRSMTDARDADGRLLLDAQRIPPFGAFLRKSSLDELPGLLNVLVGDMSLVGPRPLLPAYLPYYSERHARRHEVRPGITGLAQINGRQLARFSERMEMDIDYVDHISFWKDVEILVTTIPKVMRSRGVVVGQEVEEVDDLGLSQGLQKAKP